MSLLHHDARHEAFDFTSHFREDFYACLIRRGDTLFELCDAMLCGSGPVTSPVGLTLLAEHRRGHGALYDALNCGHIDGDGLRKALAMLPQPKAADGRLVLAVDVSNWLRPDAPCSADRLFCHVYGRSGRSSDQFIPGWPYSFVAALETGRTSWCQLLDAVRLGPDDDVAEVTAAQVRRVVTDLIAQGQWEVGDNDILVVFDAGYDAPRMAYLLDGLPVVVRPGHSLDDCEVRILAIRERAGAQRFPDAHVLMGTEHEQKRQAGNTVPVNVAYWLAQRVLASLH